MTRLTEMKGDDLLQLEPDQITGKLEAEELIHVAKMLGAFWAYDYEAAREGRVGIHAILKSGLHSDGFFNSKILLEPENILEIIARQIVMRLAEAEVMKPTFISGVPDGATKLGSRVARLFGTGEADFEKVDGKIVLATELPSTSYLMLVEDFCTRGTGFADAVLAARRVVPTIRFVLYDPVIINRGGLASVSVPGVGKFTVLPVVDKKINDWDPNVYCPLCVRGSKALKPKVSDENWRAITTSQI